MGAPELKYREKPSDEVLKAYKKKLEELLSDLNATVEIVLYDRPFDMHSSVNGVEVDVVRHWVSKILVTTPAVKDFEVRMFSEGIGEMSDAEMWFEAYNIQGRLYQHLDRNPGNPKDGDPFWKLWNKLKR